MPEELVEGVILDGDMEDAIIPAVLSEPEDVLDGLAAGIDGEDDEDDLGGAIPNEDEDEGGWGMD